MRWCDVLQLYYYNVDKQINNLYIKILDINLLAKNYVEGVGIGIGGGGGFPQVAILCIAQFHWERAPGVVGNRASIVNL